MCSFQLPGKVRPINPWNIGSRHKHKDGGSYGGPPFSYTNSPQIFKSYLKSGKQYRPERLGYRRSVFVMLHRPGLVLLFVHELIGIVRVFMLGTVSIYGNYGINRVFGHDGSLPQ